MVLKLIMIRPSLRILSIKAGFSIFSCSVMLI
jgi:hypothetical protein